MPDKFSKKRNLKKPNLRQFWDQLSPITKFLVWSALLSAFAAIIDFYDFATNLLPANSLVLHLFQWLHLFNRKNAGALVTFIVGLPLFITLWESLSSNSESRKQTELQLRPYLSAHWVSGPENNQREGQGIKSTCLKLRNDGLGLMRKVNYEITADTLSVDVRNHSVITPGSSTWVAYAENDSTELLGNPSFKEGHAQKAYNDQIIAEVKIVITGSYEDIVGGKYIFKIVSDKDEQSWFKDQEIQKKL